MALLEILTLTVGPAIAKGLLKAWLKESPIANSAATSLVDLLKTKIQDVVAQQRGKRHLEDIGERVALSLIPVLRNETLGLDENGQEAVALELATTLETTPLDSSLLATRNLEPTKLARYFREARPHVIQSLSTAETELYHHLLDVVSQRIIDIATQFPTFTVRTFAEVLSRQDQLLDVAMRILDETLRIREGSVQENRSLEAARFEEAYRLAILRRLDTLELFGVDVATASRRYRLSVAYITLSAKPQSGKTGHSSNVDRHEIESVDEVLAGTRRLLLTGAPGSGKTTLLQWMAVCAASVVENDTKRLSPLV